MHWSVTFSDNDVYDNVTFNTQMKNDYLWLITG